MERIAGAVLVCMLHLIYTCVLDQHFIGCSLSGSPECNAMAISMADVPNPSPYDDHLPESLAPACELGHDHHLHYLREFNPNDEFLTSDVLRHNFDTSVDDYFSGKYNHADDGYFLDNFEVHALFENLSTVSSNAAGDNDGEPLDNPKPTAKNRSADSGIFSVKAKHSNVKLGVSHSPMHQPGYLRSMKQRASACNCFTARLTPMTLKR